MSRRWLPVLLLAASAGLLAGLLGGRSSVTSPAWAAAPPEVQAVMWPEPRAPEPFHLHTQHGQAVGPEVFRGRWGFLFFGYLQCPDVCPTTLHAMRGLQRMLEQRDPRGDYGWYFVSIDPEHDDAEHLRDYLGYFGDAFTGLYGSQQALQPLLTSLAIKVVPFADERGVRSIDHTSSVMIIDPRGRVVGAMPPPHSPERMLERFERLRRYTGG